MGWLYGSALEIYVCLFRAIQSYLMYNKSGQCRVMFVSSIQ